MFDIFDKMFDFDHDSHLDGFETGAKFGFLDMMMNDEEETELQRSGLDPEELEFMDPWERREALEAAGLDPDEFDF